MKGDVWYLCKFGTYKKLISLIGHLSQWFTAHFNELLLETNLHERFCGANWNWCLLASAQDLWYLFEGYSFQGFNWKFYHSREQAGFPLHYWYLEFKWSLFLLSGGVVFPSLPNQDIFLIKDWVIWLEKQYFWIDDLSILFLAISLYSLLPDPYFLEFYHCRKPFVSSGHTEPWNFKEIIFICTDA